MPTYRVESFLVLRGHSTRCTERWQPQSDETHWSIIHFMSILWQQAYNGNTQTRRIFSQSKTDSTSHALYGPSRNRAALQHVLPCTWTSNLPIPSTGYSYWPAESSLEYGYYICAHEPRLHVLDCGYRLVQPVRLGMGVIQYSYVWFLYRSTDEGLSLW